MSLTASASTPNLVGMQNADTARVSLEGTTACTGSLRDESLHSHPPSFLKAHRLTLGLNIKDIRKSFRRSQNGSIMDSDDSHGLYIHQYDDEEVGSLLDLPQALLHRDSQADTLRDSVAPVSKVSRSSPLRGSEAFLDHDSVYLSRASKALILNQSVPDLSFASQNCRPRPSGLSFSQVPERPHHSVIRPSFDAGHHRQISDDSMEHNAPPIDSDDDFNRLPNHKREASGDSTNSTTTLLQHAEIRMSTARESLFIGIVAVCHFVTQAGLGLNLAPLDIISETFRMTNPGQQAWTIASYSLTVGTFILIAGRMGDIWGHKRMLAFGYAWFGVWSGFAGFSAYTRQQIFFDVCRAMQGIGPALIMPNGLALFGRAYPPGIKKNIVFSIFGAVAPAGFVTGAVFGSLFGQLTWWPWAFWSFGLALWGLAAMTLLVVPRDLSGLPTQPPHFDWPGAFAGVAALICINVAWNNGPLYGWSTPHVYFILIIGLICLGAFFWVETGNDLALLPLKALNAPVGFILLCMGLGWGAFGIWVFYSFRFLAQIRLTSPLLASAQFTPAIICGLLAAAATAFMITHTPVSFTMLIAMCAFTIGIVITAAMPAQQSYWAQMFVAVIIMPFGMDMSFPAASVILSNHMGIENQGLAMSLLNTVVNYSISIGLGIAGTVESGVVDHAETGQDELLRGFRAGLYTAVGLSAMGLLCGLMFFSRTLRKEGWNVMKH